MTVKQAIVNLSENVDVKESKSLLKIHRRTLRNWLRSGKCGNKQADYEAELTLINLYLR